MQVGRGKGIIVSLAGILPVVLLAYYGFLYFSQDKILFMPQKITQEDLEAVRAEYPFAEEVQLKTSDNLYLHGWLIKSAGTERSPLLIYFGGNGDELSDFLKDMGRIRGWSVALINYRGYGLSQGHPAEDNLYSDALAVYDYFISRNDIDAGSVAVMGRSLGTGVAVYLASQRRVDGVILVSPYDSVASVAEEKMPLAPVSLLLKHPFDSISRAPSISAPLLAIVGTEDRVIPPGHSLRLVNSWGGPHSLQIIEGADHITVLSSEDYWKGVTDFLRELK